MRSNTGTFLNDNQIEFIEFEHQISKDFVHSLKRFNYKKIWFKCDMKSMETLPNLIAFCNDEEILMCEPYSNYPAILKEIIIAQISMIDSIPIPKPTIKVDHLNKKSNTTKEEQKKQKNIQVQNKSSQIDFNPDELNISIDIILEKISAKGIRSLTDHEMTFLKTVSKSIQTEDNEINKQDVNIYRIENLKGSNQFYIKPNDENLSSISEFHIGNEEIWRLPKIEELELMYYDLHLKRLGNFKNDIYWSSTRFYNDMIRYFDFENGVSGSANMKFRACIRLVSDTIQE